MQDFLNNTTVLLAFLTRDHPFSVPVPMGLRYLEVTQTFLCVLMRLNAFECVLKYSIKNIENAFQHIRTHKNA